MNAWGKGESGATFQRRSGLGQAHPGDPMESMGNLFDVAILLAVGFLVVALSSIGLSEFLSDEQLTVVTNPGTPDMQIITKDGNRIERLSGTDETAEGVGAAVGTVYQLEDGTMVWVPTQELP